jgi:hypothetical protein
LSLPAHKKAHFKAASKYSTPDLQLFGRNIDKGTASYRLKEAENAYFLIIELGLVRWKGEKGLFVEFKWQPSRHRFLVSLCMTARGSSIYQTVD